MLVAHGKEGGARQLDPLVLVEEVVRIFVAGVVGVFCAGIPGDVKSEFAFIIQQEDQARLNAESRLGGAVIVINIRSEAHLVVGLVDLFVAKIGDLFIHFAANSNINGGPYC